MNSEPPATGDALAIGKITSKMREIAASGVGME
jgi:hypothetical protein